MTSRRMIDPAFWRSESLARLPFVTRLFFAGIFSNADDQGRIRGHPALLRSTVFPYDDISLDDIEQMVAALSSEGGPIKAYSVDGKALIQVLNWWNWQHPSWAWPSELPPLPGWTGDRLCYRRGNVVVKENWDQSDIQADDTPVESDPTVAPQRGQPEPSLSPAPSDSDSGSTSDNPKTESGKPDEPLAPAVSSFADWTTKLQASKNRPAVLREAFEAFYPGRDPPEFSYIGKVARSVGGAGRLLELLWQNSTRPPTGDVLAYCQGVHKNGKTKEVKRGVDSDGYISIDGYRPKGATSEEFYGGYG